MKLRPAEILALIIIVFAFLFGWYFYPQMPERVASHWNAQGIVDGYMYRFWGTFILPIILVPLWLLFVIIPHIDPKRENIKIFRRYYDGAILAIMLFLVYLYAITLAWNLGRPFHMVVWMSPGFGVLIIVLGALLQHTKMNWTIGFRTPWTLSSETVWEKTHALGAKLFYFSGAVSFGGILFPHIAIWLFLIPLIASVILTYAYSYWLFREENRTVTFK